MTRSTRRDFLATTSLAAASLAVGARPRTIRALPRTVVDASHCANDLLPDWLAPDDLQAMATHAVDAARRAGATYADVRVAERQRLALEIAAGRPFISMDSTYGYGIRVFVDGAMAFVHGTAPTLDAIAMAAQQAVATARGYATLAYTTGHTEAHADFVAAPVVTGQWTTPIQIDPFTVPLGAQADMINVLDAAAARVQGRGANSGCEFVWQRERRVFGSSEGSLVTQTLYRSRGVSVPGNRATLFPASNARLPNFAPASVGYEAVLAPDLPDRVAESTEVAAARSMLPVRNFDVGRFPVVLDGFSLGTMLGLSLGQALELDRASGRESDAAGTSFLAPPANILGGGPLFNPLLTVTGNRAMPSVQAVQWDDDGVVPQEFSLIKAGQVVDYCTSRDTAGALSAWYQSQGKPLRSNGCAVANQVEHPVAPKMPHLHVASGAQTASLEELYRDISRGVLILQADYVTMDQQLASGMLAWTQMYEIARGAIVRRIENTALQFATRGFWKNLATLGDASTLREAHFGSSKGIPWHGSDNTVTAPAGRFNAIDVISTGRVLA